MTEILLFIICGLLLVSIGLLLFLRRPSAGGQFQDIIDSAANLEKTLARLEASIKDDFTRNRDESARNARELREELAASLKNFSESLSRSMTEMANLQSTQFGSFSNQLVALSKSNEERLERLTAMLDEKLKISQEQINANARENREEQSKTLKSFEERFALGIKELNSNTELKLERMRETVENNLKTLQEKNEKKLEEMRATVDEKLQTTLEKRLGESFKQVSERLEKVHQGLGEMQQLAIGVGDLKKVLSNVKTRGVLGEFQLENLLDQLLTSEQYSKNVKTKENSAALVEFAVKLPGREDLNKTVWLPLDSKFPTEDYQALLDAYEQSNPVLIEEKTKALAARIKLFAKDIRDKYLDPPNTTEFGIMFLPFEGLYAEVLRSPGLFESVQRELKVVITGPTTLSALLNSLQMGFRTLAIEKRSSEVWDLLGAVKTEFKVFGEILSKTQKKLQEASNVIEDANRKSRTIERRLRDVQALPQSGTQLLLEPETGEE
jgi:DNA recombination protein RmuC